MIIGERMGKQALAHVYKRAAVNAEAPCITSAVYVEKDAIPSIRLEFANVYGYLLAIGPNDKVFSAEDAKGEIEISSWQITARSEITLKLARAAVGDTFVHGAYQMNPSSHLPLDAGTYMPILAFYRQLVTSESYYN
jgi:hypothetical protein